MRLLIALPLALAAACGPTGSTVADDTGDTGADTTDPVGDDDDDTDTPMPTVTEPPEHPGLWGKLIGGDGAALGHYDVMACSSDSCQYGVTAADGSFVFQVDPGKKIAFKTHEEISADPPRAVALEPVVIVDGPAVHLDAVFVPDLPAGVEIGPESQDPQALAVGDGLVLTLNAADLVAPFAVFLQDLGAARLPAEHVPVYPGLDGEDVVAVFAMYPFATTSTSPIAVELPTTLPSGTKVHVRSIGELDGTPSTPATATSDGTVIRTDPGQGVQALTHLVVSVP